MNPLLSHPALRALPVWLPAYLTQKRRRAAAPIDILLCICDHFEPLHDTDQAGALRRLAGWHEQYPALAQAFGDADGCRPRHTFFYPAEQYNPAILDRLAAFQRAGYGEVEIHLHHANDTAAALHRTLSAARDKFAGHGLLARDDRGAVRYGFIHGNWALDNSDPRGLNCGVNTELTVLTETGCYADFTMPAAPHPAQTSTINSLYYAIDTPAPKSHDRGMHVRVNPTPDAGPGVTGAPGTLLMVQGPLALNWRARKFGILPRIENGELAGNNPPMPGRMRIWLDQAIHVHGRPEWIFIKLHTHGCDERRGNMAMLLGEPMRQFHRHLADHYNDGKSFRLHYVTARELVNILHAAETGHAGNPGAYRDYHYKLNV